MNKKLRSEPLNIAPYISGTIESRYVLDSLTGVILDLDNIDEKIKIYERQVKFWFLNIARTIENQENTCFIVLMICLSYIEGVEQYRRGMESDGKSRIFFRAGIKRIFNFGDGMNNKIDKLYTEARCGLFHYGMTGSLIVLSSEYNEAITFVDDDTIKINSNVFLNKVIEDFDNYLCELNNNNNLELREYFDRMYRFWYFYSIQYINSYNARTFLCFLFFIIILKIY